jgi:hydrogenase large subunit
MSNQTGTDGFQVFLPSVSNGPNTADAKRVVVDPVTRIEGHLRLEIQLANGQVGDAWSAGTMFRGIETILQGRDPREAWVFAQRLCGVCTTVHSIASVRAVENALGVRVPDNARILRNLLEGSQFIHDHVIHFYHLHALDWVDVVNALQADASATSNLAQQNNPGWPNNSAAYFQGVKDRLAKFVSSGQLGLFANGYWGHPAYKLPAEGNLLAVAHYLEALEWQADFVKMEAMIGGKNPHPQTYLVGGMATPVNKNSSDAINPALISSMRAKIASGLNFVSKVYIPDLILIAGFYPEWASLGGGYGNFMSFGDFPQDFDDSRANLWMPAGIIVNKDLANPQAVDLSKVKEYIAHSWYTYPDGDASGVHPSEGQTNPNYSGPQAPYDFLNVDQKYSWLKAPRYQGMPMEVGPLARVLVAYARGHALIRQLVDSTLAKLGLNQAALFSTLGRVAARGIETLAIAQQMDGWLNQLEANMNSGNNAIHTNSAWDPAGWVVQNPVGVGMTEAPRGALGHWVKINQATKKIDNYQMIIPTTWNGSPRDEKGQRGVWEEALVGTPMARADQPLEVLRTIHSFDPCMACAVHVVDTTGVELMRVIVEHM